MRPMLHCIVLNKWCWCTIAHKIITIENPLTSTLFQSKAIINWDINCSLLYWNMGVSCYQTEFVLLDWLWFYVWYSLMVYLSSVLNYMFLCLKKLIRLKIEYVQIAKCKVYNIITNFAEIQLKQGKFIPKARLRPNNASLLW